MNAKSVKALLFSTFCGLISFVTSVQLAYFLSYLPKDKNRKEDERGFEDALWPLFIDLMLLYLFILQHSFFKDPFVKNLFSYSGLSFAERSFYVLMTSITLQIIMGCWKSVPWLQIWQLDTENRHILWWCFVVLHSYVWILIYGGAVSMDILELLGLKQVHYYFNGWENPINYVSPEMRQVYEHMRHPSRLGFIIIFWVFPVMSIDRLLLAYMWTGYMLIAWSADYNDFMYIKNQISRKKEELTPKKFTGGYEKKYN